MSSELEKNIFTQHYTPIKPNQAKKGVANLTAVMQQLQSYTHQNAIDFAEASNNFRCYSSYSNQTLKNEKNYSIQDYGSESGVRAYYRVILEKPDRYVLSACHVNIHGHHRGDLRFIEVNSSTVTRGTEKYSVMGKLFLGDTVAVTGMARLRDSDHKDVFETTLDLDCIWMATRITVLTRNFISAKFSMLEVGAVVEGQNELMNTVTGYENLKGGKLYKAEAFVPHKMVNHFTEDYPEEKRNELVNLCSKIHQPPNPLGTIFKVYQSEELTEMFDIGTSAFKKGSKHGTEPKNIVETCVLMGYAAANSVGYGRLDIREFPIQNAKRFGRTLQFHIDNPKDKPTEGKWGMGNRIQIDGRNGENCAVIETVLAVKEGLKITARLSKDVFHNDKFEGLYIVSQREPMDNQILKKGFFKEIPEGSNGSRIIQTLYGGKSIQKQPVIGYTYEYPSERSVKLNKYQAEYVEMLLDKRNPIIVGSSPFGCGKSMTIVTAALEVALKQPHSQQLLITQSNFASVNLVDIASKIKGENFRFVRFISEKNAKEMADDCLTYYDLPNMMKREFITWSTNYSGADLEKKHRFSILKYLDKKKCLDPNQLQGPALRAYPALKKGSVSPFSCLDAFFALYKPHVIMVTADSLQTLLSFNILKRNQVTSIQIDEASQLPEYSFISLLTLFPNANYGLIGDVKQLPPYCETGLEGRLKDFGVGNTMERAVGEKLFPQAMLREVYRCHPKITGILSDLFYEGKLISGVKENDRNEFMLGRPDFWPDWRFPVMVINNQGKGHKMGTSCGNKNEKEIVKQLLDLLTNKNGNYELDEEDIGVISFYKGQTSVLMDALRGRDVKCGTVDAFQGTEREVIVLCCTNENISEFMQMGNRLNVAMSRAKQCTIIVGNVNGLKKAKYWGTIVEKARKNGCIVEATAIAKLPTNPNPQRRSQRKPKYAGKKYQPDVDSLSRQMNGMRVAYDLQKVPQSNPAALTGSSTFSSYSSLSGQQANSSFQRNGSSYSSYSTPASRPASSTSSWSREQNYSTRIPQSSSYSAYRPVTTVPRPQEESFFSKVASFFGF